jgi:short-subunit dehydrogenase
MKSWALVTGASAGIGRELSKVMAAAGFNLILVARDTQRLTELASELESNYSIATRVLSKDLSKPESAEEIFATLEGLEVSILVNNAGCGSMGPFNEEDYKSSLNMLQVNVNSLVQLTRLFLPPMLNRKTGHILNMASTAAFQPGPFTALYYASKAFVFSFSMALAEELKGTGVSVTTCCPGFTKTEFHARAGMKRSGHFISEMSAQAVAKAALEGMLAKRRVIIPGALNKISSVVARHLPVRLTAKIVRRINGR